MTRLSPARRRLLECIRDHGPHFGVVQDLLWREHRVSCDRAQANLKSAEFKGQVEVKRPNRARASTWTVALTEAGRKALEQP